MDQAFPIRFVLNETVGFGGNQQDRISFTNLILLNKLLFAYN